MFRDIEGREWNPRVTCGAIAEFERRSGIRLLEQVGKMINKYQDLFTAGKKTRVPVGEILETVFSDILGGTFDNLMLLAYVSVKNQAKEREINFEIFKDSLDGKIMKEMIPGIKAEYESFFRSVAEDLITVPAQKK